MFKKLAPILYALVFTQCIYSQVFEQNEVLFNISNVYHPVGGFEVDQDGNSYTSMMTDYNVISFEDGNSSLLGYCKIFKHDKFGNLIWQIAGGDQATIDDIEIDTMGNIYLTGYQNYGLITEFNCPEYENFTYFVAKLNPDGSFAWMTRVPGKCSISATPNSVAFAVITDSQGMLDNQPFTDYYHYLLYGEISSTGNVLWHEISANQVPINSIGSVNGIKFNNNKLFVYGYYHGTLDFGGYTYTLDNMCTSNSYLYNWDMFLAEVNWSSHAVTNVISTDNLEIIDIEFDQNNNMFFALQDGIEGGNCAQAGSFQGISFPMAGYDGYILKTDLDYIVLEYHDLGGPYIIGPTPTTWINDLLVKGNDVYVAFQTNGSIDGEFYIDPSSQNTGEDDYMYLMRLNNSLNYKYHSLIPVEYLNNMIKTIHLSMCNDQLSIIANAECPNTSSTFSHNWFINGFASNDNSLTVSNINLSDPHIYPNPSNGNVHIDFGEVPVQSISVFTVTGKLIYSDVVVDSSVYLIELDTNPGMYTIEIALANGQKSIARIVKI